MTPGSPNAWPQDETTVHRAGDQFIATRRFMLGRTPVEMIGHACASEAAAIADVADAHEHAAHLVAQHAREYFQHRNGVAFDAMRSPSAANRYRRGRS